MYFHMDGFAQHHSNTYPRLEHAEFLEVDEEDLDTSNLYARVLGPEARRALLEDRHAWTANSESCVDAETLLQDLSRLAPSVAKSFAPKPTTTDGLTFRLINDMHHGGQEKSYIALSYCWSKVGREVPKTEKSEVGDLPFGWVKTVERFPLPVGEAMFQAVLRERADGEGVWFDQVCINQEDEAEKATAIGAIDNIYRNARTVVIALDDISIDEDEADFFRCYLDQYSYSDLPITQQPNIGLDPPFMQRHPLFQSLFQRILSSIWFERAWCAHEMRTGRQHVFLVPCIASEEDDSYTFIRFTGAFFLHMLLLASELNTGHNARLPPLLKTFAQRSIRQHSATSIHNPSKSPTPSDATSFIPLIASIFTQSAGGNPRLPSYLRHLDANRDRVSIALSSAGLPLVLKPASPLQRPSIEDECLRQLLLIGLGAKDPLALCTTGTPLKLHDGSVSWLCRPTSLDVPSFHGPLPRFEETGNLIATGSDGRAEYVQLDLIFLDLPHRTQPNPHFSTYIQRARAVVELCMGYQLPVSSALWASWQGNGSASARAAGLQNVFAQTLACVFECGPQWLLDVTSSLAPAHSSSTPNSQTHNQQNQSPRMQMAETLCNPHLIIQNYIRTPEGRTAFTVLIDFLATLITRGIPWAGGATERSHGPLIVSLPNLASASTTSSISPISSPMYQHSASSSASSIPFRQAPHHGQQYTQSYSPTSSPSYTTHQQAHHPSYSPTYNHPLSPSTPPKALIFAPYTHSKTLLVAVPDALSSSSYSELARAWILVPMPGMGTGSPGQRGVVSWMGVGKSVVFGGPGFGIEGDRRYQRVFGASG